MPKKVRALIQMLKKAGFVDRGGKGSHRNLTQSSGVRITLSGRPSDDARRYQEREVERALQEAKR